MLRKLLTGLALAGSLGIGSIALAGTASAAVNLPPCTQHIKTNCTPPTPPPPPVTITPPPTTPPTWHPGDPGYNNPPGDKGGDPQGKGGDPNQHGYPGNQCQQGNTWKGGDIKTDAFPKNGNCGCQDNHGALKFSDGNCDPAPLCNQGWDQKNFNQQHNWDSTCYPVVVWHAPKPAPKPCKCDVQTITFDFAPNLHAPDGTWLLETGGPALHDGETLSYDGGTWTVEQWDPHGNGSLGNDKPYFVLTNGHDLSGGGHSTQFAHTICSSIHPLFA